VGVKAWISPSRGSIGRASETPIPLTVSSAGSPITTRIRGETIASSSSSRETHSSAASAGSAVGHLTQRVP